MALLSSLSLALLKDKKPRGKAPGAAPPASNGILSSLASATASSPRKTLELQQRPSAAAPHRPAGPTAASGGSSASSTAGAPRAPTQAPAAQRPRPPPPPSGQKAVQKPAPEAKAIGSLLGAYSDSEDDDDANTSEAAAAATVAEVPSAPDPHCPSASSQAVPAAAAAGAVPASQTARAARQAASSPTTVVDRNEAEELRRDVATARRKVIDMNAIDGEELTASELAAIAHKCGPAAWRWRVKDKRPAPRGPPLGRARTSESAKVEEDPDFEDFAFLSEISAIERDLAKEIGDDLVLEETAPPIPAESSASELPPLPEEEPVPPMDSPPPPEPPPESPAASPAKAPRHQLIASVPEELHNASLAESFSSSGKRRADEKELRSEDKRRADEKRRPDEKDRQSDESRRAEEKKRTEERRTAEERRQRDDQLTQEKLNIKLKMVEEQKRQIEEAAQAQRQVDEMKQKEEEEAKQKVDIHEGLLKAEEDRQRRKKAEEQWVSDAAAEGPSAKRAKTISVSFTSRPAASTAASSSAASPAISSPERGQSSSAKAAVPESNGAPREVDTAPRQEEEAPRQGDAPMTLAELLRQSGHEKALTSKEKSRGGATKTPANAAPPAAAPEPVGWLPNGHRCKLCSKTVVEQGGVFCGRHRSDGSLAGCSAAVCWKCMNKAPRESFGKVRTNKGEFTSLGADAWWMHEGCMNASDLKDYSGDEEKGGSGDEEKGGKQTTKVTKRKEAKMFAWE